MKLAAVMMMAVVLAGNVQGKSDLGRQVTVYFNDRADVPLDVKGEAKAGAGGMFASIGITIHCPARWLMRCLTKAFTSSYSGIGSRTIPFAEKFWRV